MQQTITADSTEELSRIVAPWQLTLRQLSRGELKASARYTLVNDILVTNERWQPNVHGIGGTAPGYFTIVGNNASFPVYWKGQELVENTLVCAAGDSDCEFFTPDGANHWVMLIPEQKLCDFMGQTTPAMLNSLGNLQQCPPLKFQRMQALANRLLAEHTPGDPATENEIEFTILSCVADLLGPAGGEEKVRRSARSVTYRQAILYAESMNHAVTVSELAAAANCSLRSLQLAFQDTLGISPHHYLRLCRLNQLHSTLLTGRKPQTSVTQLMQRSGFTEPGRTAGEYRQYFGESPSATLARLPRASRQSLLNALSFPRGAAAGC